MLKVENEYDVMTKQMNSEKNWLIGWLNINRYK